MQTAATWQLAVDKRAGQDIDKAQPPKALGKCDPGAPCIRGHRKPGYLCPLVLGGLPRRRDRMSGAARLMVN